MGKSIIQFIFFANYFIGILAIALSVETSFQLNLPLNSFAFYLLLIAGTVCYYTYAYAGATASYAVAHNPRIAWYARHRLFIKKSQVITGATGLICAVFLLIKNRESILQLPLFYWLLLLTIPLAGILYYGLLPRSVVRFNLRNTGWLKAFVIGFVWAGVVSLLPVIAARAEQNVHVAQPGFMLWLFIKNWMFCTVNAIMFDLKDYADDANRALKTFVVRFGLRRTIFFILIPLLLIGIASFFTFTIYRHFGRIPILINLIPFICLLAVAWSLHKRKNILYYLVVIDGLLLLKAVCGIVAMYFVK